MAFDHDHSDPSVIAHHRAALRAALLTRALKLGQGVDRRGHRLSWTLDCREILLAQPDLHYAAALLWQRIKPYTPTLVGGMTLAADPLVAAILYEAAVDGVRLGGFIVRKEPKRYSLRQRIEGPAIDVGARVVVVDDLVNAGSALEEVVRVATDAGATVVAAGVIVDFQGPGARALGDRGIPVEALFTITELGMAPTLPTYRIRPRPAWRWPAPGASGPGSPASGLASTQTSIAIATSNGTIVAIDEAGGERWRASPGPGTHSVCVGISHSGLFVAASGEVVTCYEEIDGHVRWRLALPSLRGAAPSVWAVGGHVVLTAPTAPRESLVVALDAESGRMLWRQAVATTLARPGFDETAEQLLLGGRDGLLRSVDPRTGATWWQSNMGASIVTAPDLDSQGGCYVATADGRLHGVDSSNGGPRWERQLATGSGATPLCVGDTVLVAAHGRIVCVDRATGATSWVITIDGSLALGGMVPPSYLAASSADGSLLVVDTTSGEYVWHNRAASFAHPPCVLGDALLVAATQGGELHAFRF